MAVVGKDIKKTIALLKNDGLVAIPTETVYGLAGNALKPEVVARIFEVKNRPTFDPLIVHLSHVSILDKFAKKIPDYAHLLAKVYWPGPLTMIFEKHAVVPDLVTSGLPSVAVRIPRHPLTQELLAQLPFPLAAPSANPFGYVSPTRPEHVNDQLGEKIDYILDGGPCRVGIESTIISCLGRWPEVLRLGGVSLEQLQQIIPETTLAEGVNVSLSPGLIKSHYSPAKRLVVGSIPELIAGAKGKRTGVISFKTDYAQLADYSFVLSPTGSMAIAAQKVFEALRYMDKQDVDLIITEKLPDKGLGRAINDRIMKAAAKFL